MRVWIVVIAVAFISSLVWLIKNWNAQGPSDLWKEEDIERREPRRSEARRRLPDRPDPHSTQPLIELGYWASPDDLGRPNVGPFVDPGWAPDERLDVRTHLSEGVTAPGDPRAGRECVICGATLEPGEGTDGTYVWPLSLEHYVGEHDVRLPGLFVLHVRRSQRSASLDEGVFVERADRDASWWNSMSEP